MTQDQYGQARGSGHVVDGDVVPENETEEARTGEAKPMTRFQKVASALLGDKADDQDEADARPQPRRTVIGLAAEPAGRQARSTPAANPPYATGRDEAAMTDSPISQESARQRDYWDDPEMAAGHEDGVAATSPDTADHPATDPDMFGTAGRGTAGRSGEETADMPVARAEGQPGAATIADVPAARTPTGDVPAARRSGSRRRRTGRRTSPRRPSTRPEAPGGMPPPLRPPPLPLPPKRRPTPTCGPARRP